MYKLTNRFYLKLNWLLLFLASQHAFAQKHIKTITAKDLISDHPVYINIVKNNPSQKLVALKALIPGIEVDLKYAGTNNFTHQVLYSPAAKAYLLKPVAHALKIVQQQLLQDGLGLKVFDAYRPFSATKRIWNLVKDERYAANPAKGSGHNRGIAVDICLIDFTSKKEIDMGCGFDEFSDSAHHGFKNLPASVLQNRIRLKNIMEQAGFVALETECWHYSFPGAGNFPLLDLDFQSLQK